jgi:mono/diheme cytochrome c family protein
MKTVRFIGVPILTLSALVCLARSETGDADTGRGATSDATAASSATQTYTSDQSAQGKRLFERSCIGCHTVDPGQRAPVGLRGPSFKGRWNTARDLFSKISLTMPADKVGSLGTQEYLDILAYLIDINGGLPDTVALTRDVRRLEALRIAVQIPASSTTAVTEVSGHTYFSARQADRGAGFFQGSCGLCHTVEPKSKGADAGGLPGNFVLVTAPDGLALGDLRLKFNLAGADFIENYSTVGDLFVKVSTTMPGYDAHGLSPETYRDITAFLLRENGWPAGRDDFTGDYASMHNMPLIEPGFTKLFNGRNLTGWKALLGHNCTPPPEGCGSADPGSTFRVTQGSLDVSGRPLGYLYTEKKYLNFTLRMDYRFVPFEGVPADEPFFGNSGWLLFIQKHQVWPKMIEIQGMEKNLLDVLPVDAKAKFSVDPDARKRALKPLQWNAVEIVSKKGRIESYLNGVLVSIVTEHEFKEAGHIGLESEGGHVFFRNIRIREE